MEPKEGTFKKLVDILDEQLGLDGSKIKPESDIIEDLGADSLDVVEIVMAVEEEIGVEIDDEECERVRTVQQLVTLIDEKKAA